MMNNFSFRRFFCFILACTAFAACKKGAFDFSNASIEIDGTWGTILVNDEVAFTDFTLDSAISIVSDNNVIKIVYISPLVSSGKVEDIFSVVDYEWAFDLTDIDEPLTTPGNDSVIFSGNQDILFYGDTNQVLIDTAVFNEGNFRLVLNSSLDHVVKFRIRSTYFHYPDGRILDTLFTIPYNASNFVININLTGCRVKLQRNSLPCEIAIITYNDGHPFSGSKKSVHIDVYGTFYVFKFLQGKVVALTERLSYESDFNISSDDKMSFWVKNIRGGKIRMNSLNSFGAGMVCTIDTAEIITHGATTNLLSSANSSFQFDPAPAYHTAKKQSFTIDLDEFAIAEKNVFRFGGSVLANEPGITGPNIWSFDTSSFSIEPSLELPLDFNLNHFVYRDTISQEISKIENIDFVENLTFRVGMVNDFPLELKTQLYFMDENYKIIDSLFSQSTIIEAATTNSTSGKTLVPGKINPNPLFMEITNARLDKIYKTKYICIDARATSNNQQAIIRSDHKLKIKIGVKTTLKATLTTKSK